MKTKVKLFQRIRQTLNFAANCKKKMLKAKIADSLKFKTQKFASCMAVAELCSDIFVPLEDSHGAKRRFNDVDAICTISELFCFENNWIKTIKKFEKFKDGSVRKKKLRSGNYFNDFKTYFGKRRFIFQFRYSERKKYYSLLSRICSSNFLMKKHLPIDFKERYYGNMC